MMMKKITLATIVALTMSTGLAQAGDDDDDGGVYAINTYMTVRTDTQPSGSGDTILANCGASGGNQTAHVKVSQEDGTSKARFRVRNARPNTVYTVWLRVKGGAGFNPGGSTLTGGGATPLAPGSALVGLNDYSPWGLHPVGSTTPTNGFTTDADGDANWTANLDFPLIGGAYPFQDGPTVARPGHDGHINVPTAIVDPRTGNGGPFMIRMISHCTDGLGHGLSPGTREAWFQFP